MWFPGPHPLPNEESCKLYTLYAPTHGKRKPGGQRTLFLKYIQQLLGDTNDMLNQGQLANMAHDRCSWRKLAVACSCFFKAICLGQSIRILGRGGLEDLVGARLFWGLIWGCRIFFSKSSNPPPLKILMYHPFDRLFVIFVMAVNLL